MKLYDALTPWYRLVDPPEDHLDEATAYGDALERGAVGPVRTMLELGSGGGHNALYLKRRFHCTLTDLSPAMLALKLMTPLVRPRAVTSLLRRRSRAHYDASPDVGSDSTFGTKGVAP